MGEDDSSHHLDLNLARTQTRINESQNHECMNTFEFILMYSFTKDNQIWGGIFISHKVLDERTQEAPHTHTHTRSGT